jgi:hypothetical protein
MASTDQCAGCKHARVNHIGSGATHSLCLVPHCRGCYGFRLDFSRPGIEQVPAVKLPPLCDACAPAWLAWLDYKPPPPAIQLCTVDNTARGVLDRQRRRAEDYYATIRFQQGLIRKQCAEGNHG